MKIMTPLADQYLDRFEADLKTLPGGKREAVRRLRKSGLDIFSGLDFPGRKNEAWRFTNLTALTKGTEAEAAVTDEATSIPRDAFKTPHVMTFINGRFSEKDSHLGDLPEGVFLTSLYAELETGNDDLVSQIEPRSGALVALNTAFMEDGFVLQVAEGVTLDAPVLIDFVSTNEKGRDARHMRNIVLLGAGATLTLVEQHTSRHGHRYFANPRTDVTLAEGARLNHYKLQDESLAAFHLAELDCEITKDAVYENFSLSLGGKLSRNELTTRIVGAGGLSILNGAYLMRGEQHSDTTTLTRHLVPENDSRQVYKGVLDDSAYGVFQGKIHIAEDAQKVSGDQLSRALLLSDRATVAVKPELEIFADDVKCSHGASSGELDEDALFYLQSRGIDALTARKMLIDAFLTDVINEISNEAVREYFSNIATRWLDKV